MATHPGPPLSRTMADHTSGAGRTRRADGFADRDVVSLLRQTSEAVADTPGAAASRPAPPLHVTTIREAAAAPRRDSRESGFPRNTEIGDHFAEIQFVQRGAFEREGVRVDQPQMARIRERLLRYAQSAHPFHRDDPHSGEERR